MPIDNVLLFLRIITSTGPRDFWAVLWKKMKFQRGTLLIFIFYWGTVSRGTGEKIEAFLRFFWHQKIKLADGFMS